ncbi:MAG: DNA-3-methyladenine glycosylase I [Lachnospiraceae bacterium]
MEKTRCLWLDGSEIYKEYHDNEWGKAVHDDQKLFEMFVLESFQAGLSWITILKKRESFRVAFDGFDPKKVAKYEEAKIEELMHNEKIIRHRGKIAATIHNASLFLAIQKQFGSFDTFIWKYVEYTTIKGEWNTLKEIPSKTIISDRISKDLKKMGFKFVGSTTIYSFMQAIGMVNDHMKDCYLYHEHS